MQKIKYFIMKNKYFEGIVYNAPIHSKISVSYMVDIFDRIHFLMTKYNKTPLNLAEYLNISIEDAENMIDCHNYDIREISKLEAFFNEKIISVYEP